MLRFPAVPGYVWAPGALAATGTGAAFTLRNADFESIVAGLTLASVTGTSPTLDLYLQVQAADGNWYDMYHWAQQTGNTTATHQNFVAISCGGSRLIGDVGSKTISANTLGVGIIGNTFRFAYTIGGTNPHFTPTVNVYQPQTDHAGL